MPYKLPPLWSDLHDLGRRGVGWLLIDALLTGLLAGLVIGIFRLLYTYICAALIDLRLTYSDWTLETSIILSVFLTCCAFFSFSLLRLEPLISGSGIPQVELMLQGKIPLMSFGRVLVCKFWGTLISLISGLSLGREGPCIMMGASLGLGVGKTLHKESQGGWARFLIGGSVAGMTAAFGAPLAGLFFAFEEMRCVITGAMLFFCLVAATAAYIMVHYILGIGLVFPLSALDPLELDELFIVPLIGLAAGLLSILYNKILYGLTVFEDHLRLPQSIRVFLPFVLTFFLFWLYPFVLTTFGVQVLALEGCKLTLIGLGLLLCFKICFSGLSFASGVSGGLLMPMLCAGAIFGALVVKGCLILNLIGLHQEGVILALGMVGLFAGTVRAPLTGSFLVWEMTGFGPNIFCLLLCALCACLICNFFKVAPIYESLKERLLQKSA
ncbi:MAG: chloride channel protein [Desulfovibrionaceae bacterium]|nr:chloride channel protein [Desulfovibrionaceae bacterium]